MAPSALSRQIQMLEEELDVRLFSRTTRSVVITRAGMVSIEEAKEILQRTKSAQRAVKEAARNDGEVLRIGALDSAAAGFLPEVLYAFRQDHADVRIQLEEATTSRQLQGLVTGRLDIGFLRPPVKEPDLQWEYLTQEQLLVALSERHLLHGHAEIRMHEIVNEPLILPPKRTRPCTFGLVMHFLTPSGLGPTLSEKRQKSRRSLLWLPLVWGSPSFRGGSLCCAFQAAAISLSPMSLLARRLRKRNWASAGASTRSWRHEISSSISCWRFLVLNPRGRVCRTMLRRSAAGR
jgi:hypothetical protein